MEYVEGPDLRKWLSSEDESSGQWVPANLLSVDEVLGYTIQICQVLEYLAGRQPPVVHNDIKPGNIIVDSNSRRAVLVDFGTAQTRYLRASDRPDRVRESVYGTVGYAAPELYRGHSEPRSDVYSLAATAYHLLTDDDPRDHPSQYPKLDVLPPALADILRAALAHEITERSSAAQFQQQLERYMAGLTGPLRALTFPDGDVADERDELLGLAIKHWDYAAGILHDGTMTHWLRRTLHDPVAAQAAEVAVSQWPDNPDAALDAFVRQLSPAALPPGKLELRTTSVRLPGLASAKTVAQKIEISNQGRGFLRGEVFSTQPWLRVNRSFSCPPGRVCTVPIEIDATGLTPGQSHLAAVTLTPAGGSPEVVAVQVSVAAQQGAKQQGAQRSAAIKVSPKRVDLGTVDRKALSTLRAKVAVTNAGRVPAEVRVQGAPRWLLVNPQAFRLAQGERREVDLVGRVDKVSGRKAEASLVFAPDGGRAQEVEVLLRIKRRGLFG
jgi:hypothetical protein